jgi:hypothetical protein
MSIINRRNAVLGWGVWKIAKRVGRRKAKAAVPGNKGAIASTLAAVGGVLWFWRKKSGHETQS